MGKDKLPGRRFVVEKIAQALLLTTCAAATFVATDHYLGQTREHNTQAQQQDAFTPPQTDTEQPAPLETRHLDIDDLDLLMGDCPRQPEYHSFAVSKPLAPRVKAYDLATACSLDIPVEAFRAVLASTPFDGFGTATLLQAAQAGHVPIDDAIHTSQVSFTCEPQESNFAHNKNTHTKLPKQTTHKQSAINLAQYLETGGTYAFIQHALELRLPNGCPLVKRFSDAALLVKQPKAVDILEIILKSDGHTSLVEGIRAAENGVEPQDIIQYRSQGITRLPDMASLRKNAVTPQQFAAIRQYTHDSEKAYAFVRFGADVSEVTLHDTPAPNALITIPIEKTKEAFTREESAQLLAELRKEYDLVVAVTANEQDVVNAQRLFPPHSIELFVHGGHGTPISLSYSEPEPGDNETTLDQRAYTTDDLHYRQIFNRLSPTARILQLSCANAGKITEEVISQWNAHNQPHTYIVELGEEKFNRSPVFNGQKNSPNLAEFTKMLAGKRVVFAAKEGFEISEVIVDRAYPFEAHIQIKVDNNKILSAPAEPRYVDITWRR